ncbi:MAG: hypothetical protein Q7N50_09975 [Armatimonadota bacterium]|nr:hypothetical protein [Armatimonadota bacterium]
MPISEQVYESAVKGRRDFRQAYRDQKKQTDHYGVALMMIREGCVAPAEVAAEALAKYDH